MKFITPKIGSYLFREGFLHPWLPLWLFSTDFKMFLRSVKHQLKHYGLRTHTVVDPELEAEEQAYVDILDEEDNTVASQQVL